MKTQLKELPENRVRLDVQVPAHDVDHAFEHALHDLAGSTRVPGFRKGKAPMGLVRQRIGEDVIREEALDSHISGWYRRAVAVAGIDPIDRPTIDWDEAPVEGSEFTFSAEVAVKPRPKVKTYKGLEGVRFPIEVPVDRVEDEIERLRVTVAELTPVERAAQQDDFLVIDFTGTIDGVEIEGGRGIDHGVELGAGRLLGDLERGIEGMSVGEERDVTVVFPPNYGEPGLAGQQAVFHVVLKDVKERVLPELDDEFAMSVSEFDTLAELRADIEGRIREVVERESDAIYRGSVLDELSRQLETGVPEALVRSRMAALTRDLIDSLAARGVTTEQYLRLTGQTSEELVEQLRPQAEDAVRKDLALEAVAEDEQIEISDEMVADWVREQAAEADEDAEAAVERFTSDPAMMTMLRTDLRLQKALDIAVDNAKEITPEQAEARAKLWTPEKESEAAGGKPSTIWTPGSPDAG